MLHWRAALSVSDVLRYGPARDNDPSRTTDGRFEAPTCRWLLGSEKSGSRRGDASSAAPKTGFSVIRGSLQKRHRVSAIETVTFTRLERGPHHDGVRFTNGAEVTLQELGPGVMGYVDDLLSSLVWRERAVEAL